MKTLSFLLKSIKRAARRVCPFLILLLVVASQILTPAPTQAAPLPDAPQLTISSSSYNMEGGSGTQHWVCEATGGNIYCDGDITVNATALSGTWQGVWYLSVGGFAPGQTMYLSAEAVESSGQWQYQDVGLGNFLTVDSVYRYQRSAPITNSNPYGFTFRWKEVDGIGVWSARFKVVISGAGFVNLTPPSDGCSNSYKERGFIAEDYDIDPRIESPVGIPTDYQKVGIAAATMDNQDLAAILGDSKLLHLQVEGLWNTSRNDYAYSFDGVTWQSLAFLPVVCYSNGNWYFEITTEEYFYIRANDEAGQFADNTPNAPPFPTYSLSVIEELTDCKNYFRDVEYYASNLPINPQIETPLGPDGTPPDSQKVSITTSAFGPINGWDLPMRLEVSGSWTNGADPTELRIYEYSFDGTTWIGFTIDENNLYASETEGEESVLCADSGGIWLADPSALASHFYIRVADGPGAFGDNGPTTETDFPRFTLVREELIAPLSCADQFTYDEQDDWLASSFVLGNATAGATPGVALTSGDWYVLETAGQPWKDNTNTNRYDIKANLSSTEGRMSADSAAEMSRWKYTQCWEYVSETQKTHKRYFFQAGSAELYLWVNATPDVRAGSSGQIGYNLYHVQSDNVVYYPTACEREFAKGEQLGTSTPILAMSSIGMPIPKPLIDTGVGYQSSNLFVQGQYYLLETSGGPWQGRNNGGADASYQMQIKVNEGNESYENLDNWSQAYCIVPVDKVGHLHVYFQESVGTVDPMDARYYLRVNDGDNPGNYVGNTGSMEANVFKLTKMSDYVPPIPGVVDVCNGLYLRGQQLSGLIPIDPKVSSGVTIPNMLDDQYYAIETRGYWTEGDDSEQYLVDVSLNGGNTWISTSSGNDILCVEAGETEGSLRYFIRKSALTTFKMRAKDADQVWSNNTSFDFGAILYAGSLIVDPNNTCANNYQLELISSVDPLKSIIPSTEEGGVPLATVGDKAYALRINAGKYTDPGNGGDTYYTAQLSTDAKATWKDFKDPTQPGYLCYTKTGEYETVYFKASSQLNAVRVKDHNDDHSDNEGALYYQLYLVTAAVDPDGDPVDPGGWEPGSTVVACYGFPLKPTFIPGAFPTWSGSDIAALGEYLYDVLVYFANFTIKIYSFGVAALGYWTSSFINFFLWCPEHTAGVQTIIDDMKKVEPGKTIVRVADFMTFFKMDLSSYSWEMSSGAGNPFQASEIEGQSFSDNGNFTFLPNQENSPYQPGFQFDWQEITAGSFGASSVSSCEGHMSAKFGNENYIVLGYCAVMNLLKMTGLNLVVNAGIILSAVWLWLRYLFTLSQDIMAFISSGTLRRPTSMEPVWSMVDGLEALAKQRSWWQRR